MANKKKLSIIALNLHYGGAQRVISILLNELVKDYNVSLFLFHNHIQFDIPKEVDITILFPNANARNSLFGKLKNTFFVSKNYNQFIKTKNIDVSISFLALPNIINGIIRSKNQNLRTIISERCFPSIMYKANKSSQFLSKFVIPKFYAKNDILFSNSVNINKDLRTNFNVDMPMKVIYNPINISVNFKLKHIEDSESSVLRLINVGSIYDAKNQQMILKAMALLNSYEFHYTQAGTGVLEDELKTLAKINDLTNATTFLGNVSDVTGQLINNDCFVLSSKTEGFPNVVLEALSVGLPVISTNCKTGPLELLNDNQEIDIPDGYFAKAKYGLLVKVNDYKGLAQALQFYKNNPEERKKYCKLGFERAKEFALPNIYKQVKELIEG